MNSVYSLSQFKAVLRGLGYSLTPEAMDANRSDVLDLKTQSAIRNFQDFYQLPVTRYPDAATQEKARQLVRNLQHSLNLTTGAQLSISEFYGPKTTRAVQRFQQQQGLAPTGVATLQLRQSLETAVKQHLRQQMEEEMIDGAMSLDWSAIASL